MRRPFGWLPVLFLWAAGCQFTHHMPLKELYDQVPLGESLPTRIQVPANVLKESRTPRSWGAVAFNEWENGTGTLEWIAFFTDQGKVIAKRYQVRGEEGQPAADHYQRVDRSEWAILPPATGGATLDFLRQTCHELEFSRLGLPDSSNDRISRCLWFNARFTPVPEQGDVNADDLLTLAGTSSVRDDGRPHFDRTTTEPVPLPFLVRCILSLQQSEGRRTRLVVERRVDVALSAWTVSGWARVIAGRDPY